MRKPAVVFGEHRSSEKAINRDELKSYASYLKSPQWKTIRLTVLRERPDCELCGSAADHVHHHSYDSAVMAGAMNDLLVSLCECCHHRIEFDGKVKLQLPRVRRRLLRMLKENNRETVLDRLYPADRKIRRVDKRIREGRGKGKRILKESYFQKKRERAGIK